MCRCLMGIDVVSQHGPNPQSRTADRSVSLPDARETAAEMMGGVTSIRLQRLRARHADLEKRYGDRLRDTSAPYDQALEQVVDELTEIEAEIRELDPPDDPPPPPLVQAWDLDDPAQRKAAIEKWGGRHLDPVPDLPPGTSAMSGVEGVPGGFDFDDFDAQLAQAIEGTLESAAPTTAEQSEAWDLTAPGSPEESGVSEVIQALIGHNDHVAVALLRQWIDFLDDATQEDLVDEIANLDPETRTRVGAIGDVVIGIIIDNINESESRAVNLPAGAS